MMTSGDGDDSDVDNDVEIDAQSLITDHKYSTKSSGDSFQLGDVVVGRGSRGGGRSSDSHPGSPPVRRVQQT